MASTNSPDQESRQGLTAIDFEIDPEFIEQNKRLCFVKPKKNKFAPYTKAERTKRRKEVYRLHFELGVPAIRIAEMMKVDKNTINNDIQLLYQELQNEPAIALEDYYNKQMARLEMQRTRLMGYLDKAPDLATKLMVERLLTDIDFRLVSSAEKITRNTFAFYDQMYDIINEEAKKQKLDYRITGLYQALRVSQKGHDAIVDILKKERVLKRS